MTQGSDAQKVAVITGAGTGVGQASAVKLAGLGYRVVLLGRTAATLAETESMLPAGTTRLVIPCDIARAEAVEEVARKVETEYGRADLIVNAAGTNVPDRALGQLSLENYHLLMSVNIDGPFYLTQAFLPLLRKQGGGTFVFIGSIAGLKASPLAGPAYAASKSGVHSLVQIINLAEQANGIRAIGIHPGDINTPLLDKRPSVPPPEARAKMLQGADVAELVAFAANLPPHVVIETLIVTPLGSAAGL